MSDDARHVDGDNAGVAQPPIFRIEECPACGSDEVEKYDSRVSCDRCGWTEWRGNNA